MEASVKTIAKMVGLAALLGGIVYVILDRFVLWIQEYEMPRHG